MKKKQRRPLSSFQIIFFGFLGAILIGSLLLMLPISSRGAGGTPFLDALFTATSAVCVTGLVVHDTVTWWSPFGQAVILTLIQIGGMGVVTVAVAVALISGRKIGLMQRSTMQEAIAAPQVGGIVRFTSFIIKSAAILEITGMVLLAPVFIRDFGIKKGLWYAVFHSISAFCNAGFDLMGANQPYSSLTGYRADLLLNLTICALIITGGLGFLTWEDFKRNRLHFRKYRMQSKVVLSLTLGLLTLPTLFFYCFEFRGPQWSGQERFLVSFFQAVTARTAGFNTAELSAMSQASQLFMIILMLIGGAPGSTAGGMKTTTLAVLALSAWAVFHRREDATCFGRRIPEETVRYAAVVMMMYMTLFLAGGLFISCVEGLPAIDCLFETASAIATVGVTLGMTPSLGTASHLVLIVLMFFGRVGGLTIVYAAISGTHSTHSRQPREKITVG